MRSGNEIYAHPREQQLVVYDRNNWQVILQDKEESKMVLFNSVDKSLMICHSSETLSTNHHNSHQRSSRLPSSPNNNKICPLCKQSVTQEPTPAYPQSHSPPREESSYMVRDYFHLINYQFEQEKARDSMPRTQPPPPQSDSLPTESLNSGYYRRFFVEEQKIGAGGYGCVYLCRHMINGIDLGKYAIKKIPVGDNRPWLMRVLREVKALETLKKHPNIINYQHSWLEADKTADFGPEIPCLFILMEFANGGSLADIMFGNKKKYLSEREIWKYFMDICQGLAFLHACGVIHRDIKPHNILLNNVINKEGKTETRLLISDFGTCAMKVRDPTLKRTGATGTIEYVAPELLTKDQFGNWNEAFDEKCDVWSLGVILYEMAFQKLPFPSASYVSARDYENLTNEILGFGGAPIPITHTRSPELVQMIQILMKLNPQDRPLVSEILASPIIAKLLLQQESKVRNEQGSSSRAPGSGQLRSSSNSCKIVRLPSVDNNLDKMETETQQFMPVVPLRRRSISSGRLPPAHDTYQAKHPPLIPPFLSKYVNRFSKIAFVSLLILKLWFCLNTCSVLSNPSPMFLYPVVIAAITQLLLSDARGARLQHYQYALAGLEWLWGVFLFLVGAICIDPDASENFVIQHAALTLLTITSVYLTNK